MALIFSGHFQVVALLANLGNKVDTLILVHTALLSEAQSVIEKYKLTLVQKNPKIYKNENIVLIISGIGKQNTIDAMEFIFKKYKIKKAINLGIAGCNNKNINIGELFCTNKTLEDIKFLDLQTVDTPKVQIKDIKNQTYLYDMEAKYFEKEVTKYIDKDDIYIFKVVSDWLDDTIPSKEFVKQLIRKNLKKLEKYL